MLGYMGAVLRNSRIKIVSSGFLPCPQHAPSGVSMISIVITLTLNLNL